MYHLCLEYQNVPSGVDIERALYLNDEVPFLGADTLLFSRMWTDEGGIRTDNQGNQIRPRQAEVVGWQQARLKDPLGYETAPSRFYFKEGSNSIRLVGINEPMALRSLTLLPPAGLPGYEAYRASLPGGAGTPGQTMIEIPGEAAPLRSSPSLYARYDRSSPATRPSDLRRIVLNYIGGDPWRVPGQWIEWEAEVPEDGLYSLTIKGRQRYQRGSKSSRTLMIDGEVPFAELAEIPFEFANAWEMKTLGAPSGEPYEIYLTKGRHRLRLEATLGGMGRILTELDDSVFRLNQMYRKILVLTGVSPDTFRDYNLQQVYPEVLEAMALKAAAVPDRGRGHPVYRAKIRQDRRRPGAGRPAGGICRGSQPHHGGLRQLQGQHHRPWHRHAGDGRDQAGHRQHLPAQQGHEAGSRGRKHPGQPVARNALHRDLLRGEL